MRRTLLPLPRSMRPPRLWPPPEFICFLGDEISGLTTDGEELQRQWRYWFDHELAWLDRHKIPLYHTTGHKQVLAYYVNRLTAFRCEGANDGLSNRVNSDIL